MKEYEEDDEMYAPPSIKRDLRNDGLRLPPAKLPKLEDQKPMIGPTGSDGKIKVHYKAAIDGFLTNSEDMTKMAELGLPTGFVFGSLDRDSRLRSKKQKATYYCDLCLLELNSEDTMKAHMAGSKHMKKYLAAEQQKIATQNTAEIPTIKAIQNPVATRKKVPIRLHQKISDSPQPIVGLNHVKEYIACSNSEMEPHYECHLCETQGQANCMFQHLVGAKHRQAAVNEYYNNDPEKISLSQAELLRFAEEMNENDDKVSERIVCKYSDDEYPWPAGMEPWLIERGGSGIIPDGARCNFGKNMPKPSQNRNFAAVDMKPKPVAAASICGIIPIPSRRSGPKIPIQDLHIQDLKTPRNKEEGLRMIEVGKDLILKAMEFNKSKSEDRHMMTLTTDLIKTAVLQRRGSVLSPSPSTRSLSSSSVGSSRSRERSTSRDYESSSWRREGRRHSESGRHDRDQGRDWVKTESRRYEYSPERRKTSRDDNRRDDRRSHGHGYYN